MFKKDVSFKQNNKVNCQICPTNDHHMRAKYTNSCNCESASCMRRFRAYMCCSSKISIGKQKVELFVMEKCLDKNLATTQRQTKDRGVSPIVKIIINRMIKENMDLTPKVCHQMLMNGGKIQKNIMPNLYQVSCFVNW